jgi:hypothetical protein
MWLYTSLPGVCSDDVAWLNADAQAAATPPAANGPAE